LPAMQNLNTSFSGILKVTAPLVVAGIAMNLVGVIDLILVTGLGEAQVGGTGNGQLLYGLLFVIGMGFTSGMQIIIGRRNGSHDYKKIGGLFFQGMYFVMAFSILLFGFIQWVIPGMLTSLFKSVNVVHFSTIYMTTRGWGILFTLANLLFIGFFVGITKTKILGIFTPFISALNIGLDLALINGYGPFPEMGVQGAALASVISEGAGTVMFIIYTLKFVDLEQYGLARFIRFNWQQTKIIFEVAAPIMIQNIVSIGAWFSFFVFVENLGERALAISQMIRGIYIFIMVPVFSLADAANTFVSNLMGEKNFEKVLPVVVKTLGLGLLVNAFFFAVINMYPEFVMGLFTSDTSVFSDAILSVQLTTYSMFLFTMGFIPFRAISGTGNTRTALLIESLSVIIYLGYTYYASVIMVWPLHLVWASEFVYFGFLIVLSWGYLRWGNWKSKEI
jgi:putative MATE family efflux protein